jgi:hypothetical protein
MDAPYVAASNPLIHARDKHLLFSRIEQFVYTFIA